MRHAKRLALLTLFIGSASLAQGQLASSAWPKFRGDAQNTGQGSGSGATGVEMWENWTGRSILSSPALGTDGTIYIGSTNNKVYAIH